MNIHYIYNLRLLTINMHYVGPADHRLNDAGLPALRRTDLKNACCGAATKIIS
jgi:hypothetical protein